MGDRDEYGCTALHYCAMYNFTAGAQCLLHPQRNLNKFRQLFEQPQDELLCTNAAGDTALHLAVKYGANDVARLLAPLECGKRDGGGMTALMRAAMANQADLA